MIGERFSHYQVTGKLGAGGMGEVYRAQDTTLKREVAIKVLPEAFARDEERMKRFEREAQVLASLNHPNIAAIYGLEEVDGVRALVLELVEGPTLAERIADGPMPVEEAVRIARQIAIGLEAAHEKAVTHRDLKPANAILTKDGDVKILDFGPAKALEGETPAVEDSNSPTLTRAATQAGVLLGTAAYMSPEQAKGKPVDRRSDVWAFGVVLFEMLTGTRLFSGETASETLASVIKDEPALERLPAATPRHIRWLVHRCLTKDPTERLQAIGEARIAIDRPEIELDTSVTSSEGVGFKIALAAFALLVGSVITGVAVWRWKPEAPRAVVRVVAIPPSAEPLDASQSDVSAAISPDGTRIVYVAQVDGTRQLVVRALDEWETTPLPALGSPRGPFFSPDGNWVGYFDGIKGLRKVSIVGGPPITVCAVGGDVSRGASWGGDGTIVFATRGPGGLWRVTAEGGEPEELTQPDSEQENHLWPEILPGGEAVLFTIQGGAVENARIAALSLSTGESKVLVPGGSHPRYVATGHLVYRVSDSLLVVGFDLDRLEVTSEPVPILEDVVRGAWDYRIARNGSLVYVEDSPGSADRTLVWVDRQGQEEVLTAPPRFYTWPQLSPDRSHLALEADHSDIWIWDFGRETLTSTNSRAPTMFLSTASVSW